MAPAPSPSPCSTAARLTLADLEAVARDGRAVALDPSARERRGAVARAWWTTRSRSGAVVYGVNTGFGNFADVVIPPRRSSRELQLNLVRSHAAGVGEPARRGRDARAHAAARERAGQGLSRRAARDPRAAGRAAQRAASTRSCPRQGSVGASGDLAPLAHLALALIGEGDACARRAAVRRRRTRCARAGLAPVVLEAKEGLALINGTQLMTAVAGLALAEAWRLARTADVAGALTLDALKGTDVAFDPRIHAARPHPGQAASARNLRRLLAGSAAPRVAPRLRQGAGRLQPALHAAGARRRPRRARLRRRARSSVEMNAATDNPMVFAETGELLSGGNFHGEPVAMAADVLAIAVAELGAISERRIERLVNPTLSGLPAFLTRDGGLQSGLMIAQVTAAALASENKTLAHPASVDSIPTSANKEDHVSMGVTAARKAARAVANTRRILAIELLAACQALEFQRPLATSRALEAVHARVRETRRRRTGATGRSPPTSRRSPARRGAGDFADAAAAVCGTLD